MSRGISIFDFQDYKKYLNAWLLSPLNASKGLRVRMATRAGCQPAYISHVLNGSAHFSPDQAFALNDFLDHSASERAYFLNLVHYAKAQSPEYKKQLLEENKKIFAEVSDLQKKIKSLTLSDRELKATFYSSWHYGAVHMAVIVAHGRDASFIAQSLQLPPRVVEEALDFLVQAQLIKKKNRSTYEPSERQIHLPPDSPLAKQHHANWRLKCLAELNLALKSNFHYSSVVAISEKDLVKLRQIMSSAVEAMRKNVAQSTPEDVVYAYSLDLYRISQ